MSIQYNVSTQLYGDGTLKKTNNSSMYVVFWAVMKMKRV